MRLASLLLVPGLEGGPTIRCPGKLEDAWCSLHPFHAQPYAEGPVASQVIHGVLDSNEKRCLLPGRELVEVSAERPQAFTGGHGDASSIY